MTDKQKQDLENLIKEIGKEEIKNFVESIEESKYLHNGEKTNTGITIAVDIHSRNKHYQLAQAVYQHIIERDYMPEPVDFNNQDQEKFYMAKCNNDLIQIFTATSIMCIGVQYMTAKPDINKIKNEMGKTLWESLLKGYSK